MANDNDTLIGGTIRVATDAIVRAPAGDGVAARAARSAATRDSQANGALMRQSPLGIWGHAMAPEELDAVVRRDTTLTHPNEVCQDASAAFVVAEGLEGQEAYARALAWQEEHGSRSEVTRALREARDALPVFDEHSRGWVLVALQNAFYQALHAQTFEDGVVETVMGGGDTDTNGAIAGALLGAIHGVEAIPAQWREAVLSCRPDARTRQPRPEVFWPVDAPELADRLVERKRHSGCQDPTAN